MPKIPLIVEIGTALFGPHWVRPLAAALEVSERTVRYWQDGERSPPPGVLEELQQLCVKRRATLQALEGKLAAERP